jgi:uncharacterized RDD family membrane protein YckC
MTRAPGQVAGRVSAAVQEAPVTTHAGVVTRLLAACVDVAVVVLATVLVDLAAAGVRFAWAPMAFRWPQPAPSVAVGALLAVAVVYLTVGWATAGRTYGARLLGLRVLSMRLARLGWIRSFLRAVACVFFPVGLLWCVVSPDRRSVQDVVFRSVVLYDWTLYREPEAAGRH